MRRDAGFRGFVGEGVWGKGGGLGNIRRASCAMREEEARGARSAIGGRG